MASMIARTALLPLVTVAGLALVAPRTSEACECTGWKGLEESVEKAPAAVVGRVLGHGNAVGIEGVAFLYVKVIDSIKGPKNGTTIRVWDTKVGSTCSLELEGLAPDSIAVFALWQSQPANRERLPVRPGDYLLGACGEYFRKMESEAVAHAWATRARQRGKSTR